MRNRIQRWHCLSILFSALTLVSLGSVCMAEKSDETLVKIESMIQKISTEQSSLVRVNVAEQLSAFLQHQNRSCLDALTPKVIDDIAGLLSDREDAVRFWAALALGHIGARASRAVPKLEKALEEAGPAPGANNFGPDLGSASAIRGALRKITAKPARD